MTLRDVYWTSMVPCVEALKGEWSYGKALGWICGSLAVWATLWAIGTIAAALRGKPE